MSEKTVSAIVRAAGEGEQRWFYGGGVHTWKVTAADTEGALSAFEDELVKGKTTPLHRHPHAELVYLIEGELLYVVGGVEHRIERGATILTPAGVDHAFLVVSERARMLAVMAPGKGEDFYRLASEPYANRQGEVDFTKLREASRATGTTEIVGPPPFRKP